MKKRIKLGKTSVHQRLPSASLLDAKYGTKLLKINDLLVSSVKILWLARRLQCETLAMNSSLTLDETSHLTPLILVVDSHAAELGKTAAVLRGAGYDVVSALGFVEARRTLDRIEPAVLVTSVRLGPYNGLHLVVRSRVSRPSMAAILTHDIADPVLEREARGHEAAFLLTPVHPEVLLDLVKSSVNLSLRASAEILPH